MIARCLVSITVVAVLGAGSVAQSIVVNEIHYNPAGSGDPQEFIELYNSGAASVVLTGWTICDGVVFAFDPNTVIAASGYLVIAKSPAELQAATGYGAALQWASGALENADGERVAICDPNGTVVDEVFYHDRTPWPAAPDGDGPSLELINPALDNSQPNAWRASSVVNGTPGAINSVFSTVPRISQEVPPRMTAVESLTTVSVTFGTPVTGVDAGDLLVAGSPATSVVPPAGPADTYAFSGFAPPSPGAITITLLPGDIVDGALVPFAGDTWTLSIGLRIVINEIHYHPPDPYADAEFVEFYNAGSNSANMGNWAMADAVELLFPSGTTVPPGGYLVIAADPNILQARTGYVGALPWTTGRLSNGGERVALVDQVGNLMDQVTYSDAAPWPSAADGTGPSLELVNPAMLNEYGTAWRASTPTHGTPGAQNSMYLANAPPIIFDTLHSPPIPAPLQAIQISSTVLDDAPDPNVTLYYRQDQDPTVAYTAVTMYDDGAHGDGAASDHRYGVEVPGLADGERLDFTIRASDGENTSAAPAGHNTLVAGEYPAQTFLCKFTSAVPDTEFPTYHLITTQHTRNLQNTIDRKPYDATFIQMDTQGNCRVFYNVIEHYRGHSTLTQTPHGFRIDFPDEQPLPSEMGFEITDMDLMAQEIDRQYLGYRFFRTAFGGTLPASLTQFVRLNTCPLAHGGVQNWIYVNIERQDERFTSSEDGAVLPERFPAACSNTGLACGAGDCPGGTCVERAAGNLYRGRHTGNLDYRGTDPNSYRAPVQADGSTDYGYDKETNEAEDDWTDLITLCYTIDRPAVPDVTWEADLCALIDEQEWARWFAIHALLANGEGGIYRDEGDDYFLYFEPPDSPFGYNAKMIPWDMDGVWGGHWYATNYWEQPTIWRTGCGHPCNSFQPCPAPVARTAGRFVRSNAFAGRFVQAICELLDNEFATANIYPMIDAIPASVLDQSPYFADAETRRAKFKSWVTQRIATVRAELVTQLTLNGVPSSPYLGPDAVLQLSGNLNQCGTHDVLLNGTPVDAFQVFKNPFPSEPCTFPTGGANWSTAFTLAPGRNDIVVQCLDHTGAEVERVEQTVQYYNHTYDSAPASLRLTAPTRMVAAQTLTLQAELLDDAGNIHWQTWNTLGTVSARRLSDSADVPVSITVFETYEYGVGGGVPPADSIRLYNGVGSVSITLDDPAAVVGQSIAVAVSASGLVAERTVTVLPNVPETFKPLQGTLSGADLTWGPNDGVIHLTENVSVPSGQTLTILPGALIMVDAGPPTDGTRILLNNSNVTAQGTAVSPIFFFATSGPPAMVLPQGLNEKNNPNAWRGFLFEGAGSSTLAYVFLTGAGNGAVELHPRPPVFYLAEGATHDLTLTNCVFADAPGEIVFSKGSGTYTISHCLFSRVGIGMELVGSNDYTAVIEDCWFARIGRAPEANNVDGDILHLDQVTTVQPIVRRCILTDGGDDLIDHSNGARPVVEDCILYDGRDKAISLYYSGDITMTNCLVFDVPGGIRATGQPVFLTNCTFGRNTQIDDRKCDSSSIQKCIFWPISVVTCCNVVDYSLIGEPGHLGCGTCNLSADPLFVDPNNNDFSLQAGSPALDVCGQGRIGWLGFPEGQPCTTAAQCDDGNACTLDECQLGVCVHPSGVDCSALDDVCEIGTCNPATGACETQPRPDGTPCDDGLYCTAVDACLAGVCVGNGNTCDDGVGCTDDLCDEDLHTCTHTPNDGSCPDDGLFCNGDEYCDAELDCSHTGDPCGGLPCNEGPDTCGGTPECETDGECNDDNPCTDDACVEHTCVHTPNTLPCDDGLFCTVNDTCAAGVCTGTPRECGDSLDCTADTCDDANDACVHTLRAGFCLIEQTCYATATRNPGNVCQWCDPPVDAYAWTGVPNGTSCTDGSYCNGEETCQGGACVAGSLPCTDACEQCDEAGDTCVWCMYDLDASSFIGPGDFSFFAGCFGQAYAPGAPCRVCNFDGDVNGFVGPGDFSGFAGCFGSACGSCSTCWGARGALRDDATAPVLLELVALRTPTPGDVASLCPPSDRSFAVGSIVQLEVWASAGPRTTGLAAAYFDALSNHSALEVVAVVPSESFSLFTNDRPSCTPEERGSTDRLHGVGGCARLGATRLGADSQWVRIGTLRMRVRLHGPSEVRLAPADAGYGVALIDQLGVLSANEIAFGACQVELPCKPSVDLADETVLEE